MGNATVQALENHVNALEFGFRPELHYTIGLGGRRIEQQVLGARRLYACDRQATGTHEIGGDLPNGFFSLQNHRDLTPISTTAPVAGSQPI